MAAPSRFSVALSLAVVAISAFSLLVDVADAAACDGLGTKYCTKAHTSKDCPDTCRPENCRGRRSTELLQDGAARKGGRPLWEEMAFSGLYEHVYSAGDDICLATCWYQPWEAECTKWENLFGMRYCMHLDCEHDRSNRFSGCHADPKGRKKLPWHKPTCAECARVFPTACAAALANYIDGDVGQNLMGLGLENNKDFEVDARKYCYLSYFGFLFGIDVMADESSKSDSSSGRRLMFSSAEADESQSQRKLDAKSISRLVEMERSGELTCPAPQCLTSSDALLESVFVPWYMLTTEGTCHWGGCSGAQDNTWCSTDADKCVRCRGTWCPPESQPYLPPVTNQSASVWASSIPSLNRTVCSLTSTLTDLEGSDAEDLEWPEPSFDVLSMVGSGKSVNLWGLQGTAVSSLDPARTESVRMRAKQAEDVAYNKLRQRLFDQTKSQAREELRLIVSARDLEEKARLYCAQLYVPQSGTTKTTVVAGSKDMSRDTKRRSSDDSSDSESSSGRRLQSSSESGELLSSSDVRMLASMRAMGALKCPPQQCYVAPAPPTPAPQKAWQWIKPSVPSTVPEPTATTAPASPPVSPVSAYPWYHVTADGFCSFDGDCSGPGEQSDGWCRNDVDACIRCLGTWCPPLLTGWEPVTSASYKTLPWDRIKSRRPPRPEQPQEDAQEADAGADEEATPTSTPAFGLDANEPSTNETTGAEPFSATPEEELTPEAFALSARNGSGLAEGASFNAYVAEQDNASSNSSMPVEDQDYDYEEELPYVNEPEDGAQVLLSSSAGSNGTISGDSVQFPSGGRRHLRAVPPAPAVARATLGFGACTTATLTGMPAEQAWGLAWPGIAVGTMEEIAGASASVSDAVFEERYINGRLAGLTLP